MSINCRGVKTKTADIATVIDKHKLDFILGNDPWLNPNIESNEIVPENYKAFRKDRVNDRNCGGVLQAMRNGMVIIHRSKLRDYLY